jgi:hypothetical protein
MGYNLDNNYKTSFCTEALTMPIKIENIQTKD